MKKLRITLAVLPAMLMAGAAAQETEEEVFPPDESVPSERCINHQRIRSTEVVNERNILFHMRGGEIYRNVLPRRCPGLNRNDSISYRPRTSKLCDLDAVTVLLQTGAGFSQGASCGLGKFYPITKAEADALKEEVKRARELKLED
jgi:hypothetical protein